MTRKSTNCDIIHNFVYFNNRRNRLVRQINPATMRGKRVRLERRLSYIDNLTAVPFLTQVRDTVYPGGGTLGLFGWGCAAGTLEPWNPYPIPELVQVNFATLY